jgi:WD40 repeat protein
VSIGRDRHLKIWHINDKRLEMDVVFQDEPLCVAVHPSGLSLLVGFLDRLALYSVLLNELQLVREFNVRSAAIVKYSSSGEYFAVAAGSTLYVFDSVGGRVITSIRIQQGRIKSMNWLLFDKRLLTVRSDGRVDKWDVFTGASLGDYSEQLTSLICGVGNLDGHRAVIATSDAQLKDVAFNGDDRSAHCVLVPGVVSNMLLLPGEKLLIASASDAGKPGSILVCQRLPRLAAPSEALLIHGAPITAMCLSRDGHFLYTSDANGAICVTYVDFDEESVLPRYSENFVVFGLRC